MESIKAYKRLLYLVDKDVISEEILESENAIRLAIFNAAKAQKQWAIDENNI